MAISHSVAHARYLARPHLTDHTYRSTIRSTSESFLIKSLSLRSTVCLAGVRWSLILGPVALSRLVATQLIVFRSLSGSRSEDSSPQSVPTGLFLSSGRTAIRHRPVGVGLFPLHWPWSYLCERALCSVHGCTPHVLALFFNVSRIVPVPSSP
jgi:hypothetical protein